MIDNRSGRVTATRKQSTWMYYALATELFRAGAMGGDIDYGV
jgi:hypothetical protein